MAGNLEACVKEIDEALVVTSQEVNHHNKDGIVRYVFDSQVSLDYNWFLFYYLAKKRGCKVHEEEREDKGMWFIDVMLEE